MRQDAALQEGVELGLGGANKNRYFYRSPTGTFANSTPIDGQAATHGNGSTIGFTVQSAEQEDAVHAAGVANGGTTCEDPPGFREGPLGKIYLAYLHDPDGNKDLCLAPAVEIGRPGAAWSRIRGRPPFVCASGCRPS